MNLEMLEKYLKFLDEAEIIEWSQKSLQEANTAHYDLICFVLTKPQGYFQKKLDLISA
jgi:hypothetical protein